MHGGGLVFRACTLMLQIFWDMPSYLGAAESLPGAAAVGITVWLRPAGQVHFPDFICAMSRAARYSQHKLTAVGDWQHPLYIADCSCLKRIVTTTAAYSLN